MNSFDPPHGELSDWFHVLTIKVNHAPYLTASSPIFVPLLMRRDGLLQALQVKCAFPEAGFCTAE